VFIFFIPLNKPKSMTYILKFLSVLFLLCLLLSSCGDSEVILLEDFEELPSNSLSMIVDGSAWSSDSIQTGLGVVAGSFSILGYNDSDLSALFILASSSVGTYELGTTNGQTPSFSAINFSTGNFTTVNTLASGQIEIVHSDELNKTISGRFNAMVVNSMGEEKTVTNGLFNELSYE